MIISPPSAHEMIAAGPAATDASSAPKSQPEPMIEPTLAKRSPITPTCRLSWGCWVSGAVAVSVAMQSSPGAPGARVLKTTTQSAHEQSFRAAREAQPALKDTVCHPVAPLGTTSARAAVWVYPERSVARTATVWLPEPTSADPDHCTQVSLPGTRPSSACRQASPSIRNSTFSMPVCCARACPPTRTVPDVTSAPSHGASTRDSVFTEPCTDQPP